ncbi:MAG: hypothetical protein ACRDTM_16090 [Micromonosporaceae bacterium]
MTAERPGSAGEAGEIGRAPPQPAWGVVSGPIELALNSSIANLHLLRVSVRPAGLDAKPGPST